MGYLRWKKYREEKQRSKVVLVMIHHGWSWFLASHGGSQKLSPNWHMAHGFVAPCGFGTPQFFLEDHAILRLYSLGSFCLKQLLEIFQHRTGWNLPWCADEWWKIHTISERSMGHISFGSSLLFLHWNPQVPANYIIHDGCEFVKITQGMLTPPFENLLMREWLAGPSPPVLVLYKPDIPGCCPSFGDLTLATPL